MTTKSSHTPLPWKVSQTGNFVMHSRPGTVLNICEASVEDAAFICKAVNSHKELLDALKKVIAWYNSGDTSDSSLGHVLADVHSAISRAEANHE